MRPLRAVVVLALVTLVVPVVGCATDDAARRRDRSRARRAVVVDEDAASRSRSESIDPARAMTVHLLDVGQGAATLVEFPCGAMLVDTGGEQNEEFDSVAALKQQLDWFFARRTDLHRTLDVLVITHPHIDHVRGVPMVLENFTVRNIVDNGTDGDALVKDQIAALRAFIAERKPGYRGVKITDIVKKGGLVDEVIDPFVCPEVDPAVRVLWGSVPTDPGWGVDRYGNMRFANQNNHSVVVRVDVGNGSLLITGDLEEIAIGDFLARYEGTRWLDVDVYQVGHHGSHNGTTGALMTATTPLVSLIAMGPEHRHRDWTAWAYGHPRATTVDKLERGTGFSRPPVEKLVATGARRFDRRTLDRAIYGTGWDGAVRVVLDVEGAVRVVAPP